MKLIAYRVLPDEMPISPSSPLRGWMDASPIKLAHGCHPLLIANQAGWSLLNPDDVEAKWNGRPGLHDLRIRSSGNCAGSNFGMGIVTWRLPYVFRTPPGWHLWVKGPANFPLDGAAPLEGIVETDHAHETFTMNWKLTRRGRVRWARGEPICQILPLQTGQLPAWEPEIVERAPRDVTEQFHQWAQRRMERNARASDAAPYRPALDYRRRAVVRRLSMPAFRARDERSDG